MIFKGNFFFLKFGTLHEGYPNIYQETYSLRVFKLWNSLSFIWDSIYARICEHTHQISITISELFENFLNIMKFYHYNILVNSFNIYSKDYIDLSHVFHGKLTWQQFLSFIYVIFASLKINMSCSNRRWSLLHKW